MTIPARPATTLVEFRGKPVDKVTRAFAKAMEAELGYELTIVQGYNPSNIETSAGTHLFGVIDLAAYDGERKVAVARKLGAFAWLREEIPGHWAEHVHLGIRNHPGLSDTAKRQQLSYDAKPPRDGLVSNLVDANRSHPSPPVEFDYRGTIAKPAPVPTEVTRARDALVESIHATSQAIARLKATDVSRHVARSYIDDLQAHRRQAREILESLPLR
jgi:hypothetical protein